MVFIFLCNNHSIHFQYSFLFSSILLIMRPPWIQTAYNNKGSTGQSIYACNPSQFDIIRNSFYSLASWYRAVLMKTELLIAASSLKVTAIKVWRKRWITKRLFWGINHRNRSSIINLQNRDMVNSFNQQITLSFSEGVMEEEEEEEGSATSNC